MKKTDIFTKEGKKKEKIDLPEEVFGLKWNGDLVAQVVSVYETNMRQGSAHSKDRSEVRGGGRKPWRQKGTGRARHGSIRSPIWAGGGVTFGPRNERKYQKKSNLKMRRKALFVSLSQKLKDEEVFFIESFDFKAPKTKDAKKILEDVKGIKGLKGLSLNSQNAVLLVLPSPSSNFLKSFNNIGGVSVIETRNLNARDILKNKYVVFVNPEESIKILLQKTGTEVSKKDSKPKKSQTEKKNPKASGDARASKKSKSKKTK